VGMAWYINSYARCPGETVRRDAEMAWYINSCSTGLDGKGAYRFLYIDSLAGMIRLDIVHVSSI